MQILLKHPNSAVVISSFFWGTYWIPLRFIDKNGSGSVWPIIASFFILSIFLIKPLINAIKNLYKNKDTFFFIGNFLSALAIALYSESFLRGDITTAVLLFYLCPVWGTILARIILKQQFNFQRYLSLILGLIGLEIILGFDKGFFFPKTIVEWMALAAGFTWSLGITFFHLSKTSKGLEKTALTGFMIPFLFFFLSFIPGGRENQLINMNIISNYIYLWMLLFSIAWFFPSMFFTFISVEILDPGRINILFMFEVVIGITSAALLANEIIGLREMIGAIIIISAGAIELIKFKY